MPKLFNLNTARPIPWLGFGTGTALFGRDASNLIRLAIDNGIRHLDGAQAYGNEDTLGAGIKASGKPRSELFVTTKLNGLRPGETIRESLQKSLAKLGLNYVDLFLIHDPSPAMTQGPSTLEGWWKQMEGVHAEGLSKSIGVSNCRVEELKIILESGKIVPAANQIELHPYVWKAAAPIVKLCHEKGIVVESYGGLTPINRVRDGPLDPGLKQLCERVGKSYGQPVNAGQILTKWLLAKDIVVLTTTTKVGRMRDFLDVENIPDLSAEQVHQIDEAGSQLHRRIFLHHVYND